MNPILAISFVPLLLGLQSQPGPSVPLSPQIESETIEALGKDMNRFYVFPDLAAQTLTKLRTELSAGSYAGLSGPDFAHRVTEDMRSVCHDAHLHLSFSQDVLPPRTQEDRPGPDEIAARQRFERAVNGGVEKVERLPGNVGYVELRGFLPRETSKKPIDAAMGFLANADAVILDLRRNGGGDPATVQYLCSYFFDSKPVHLNDIYFRPANQTQQFWTERRVDGLRLAKTPVYVLTSKRTGSGAEECAYDLQNLHRATILGESTWGGANPGDSYRLNDHFTAFVPNGRAINPYTHTNWEGAGVTPDIKVPATDALVTAQRLALEKLLSEAKFPDDKERYQGALQSLRQG